MTAVIHFELKLLFLSLFTGVGLMIVYDLLRIFRMAVRHVPLLTGVEDFGYWIYAAWTVFSLLYEQNDGVLRGYAIVGVLAGMWAYDRTCSRLLLKVLKNIGKSFRIRVLKRRNLRKQR